MTARIGGLVMAVLFTMMVSPTGAQSLGDVARQEGARREQIKAPAKVFTNADLPKSAVEGEAETPAPEASGTASTLAAAAGETAKTDGAEPPKDDEAGWRTRASQVNGKYAEAQTTARLLKALSDRLGLEMQASNPDIAQRAATERAQVKLQLAEAEQKEAAAREAKQAFEREARTAGVPPAWIQ